MNPPDAPPPGATILDGMLEDMLERRYLVVDGHGRVSRWSAGAERLLGWREEEVTGRSAFSQPLVWAGEGIEPWKTYFESGQTGRPPAHTSLMMLCRGGWGLAVEMTAVPVPLVLGYEFTMLVADLAVGGPGSQSPEQLAQVHPLAADAIASALHEDASAPDSVAGLLLTLRAVADAAVIEDPDAEHAARALAIDRPDAPVETAADDAVEDNAEAGATAEDLAAAQASLHAASAEVTRLREEIGRLRSELGEQAQCTEQARAEAGRLAAELDQAAAAEADRKGAAEELERVRQELKAANQERDALMAERARLQSALDVATAGGNDLRQALDSADAERADLAAEQDRLRQALEAATAEGGQAAAAQDRLRQELEEVRAQHAELTAERDRLQTDLEAATGDSGELAAERDRLWQTLEQADAERAELAANQDRLRQELEASNAARAELASAQDRLREALEAATAEGGQVAADQDRLRRELEAARARHDELATERDAERAELAASLAEASAERDQLRRELEEAHAALGDAVAASEGERERELLRTELERASQRCEELSSALDAKTAELQSLPGKAVVEAATRDRDEARAALAAALAERDRAADALEAAASERESAGDALRQAEAERDEGRRALEAMASESEAARASVAEHETRAEALRDRLAQAERAANEREAEVREATREATEQRERVAASFLETEAIARERARVSDLEAQIASLTRELEGALARAAEHAPVLPGHNGRRREMATRPFQPGLDDAAGPRAHIGLDGRFIALNNRFSELVGYSESEFGDAYWPPVVDAENRSELRRATARVIAGELPSYEVDTLYMAANGTLIRIVGSLRLDRDESGAATHLVLDAEPLSALTA